MKHEVKRFVVDELAQADIRVSFVVVDKQATALQVSELRGRSMLYNYATRYLVERLSWLARDNGLVAKLTFEHRASLDYEAMRAYFALLRGRTGNQVQWDSVNTEDLTILQGGQRRWLQAADSAAGSMWNALVPNRFGQTEPSYLQSLSSILYRRPPGRVTSYGLKFMPGAAAPKWIRDLRGQRISRPWDEGSHARYERCHRCTAAFVCSHACLL